MKKVIFSLMALVAVMICFSGCAANDHAVNVGAAAHDVAKFGYKAGAKELLDEASQNKLETSSEVLDNYGEAREAVRGLQDGKKQDVSTSQVQEN